MTTLAPIHTAKMTAEQYFMLGEDPPGVRLELIDGEIIVSPSPAPSHAKIVFKLAYMLETHLRMQGLGELYLDTDVKFHLFTARRPDISYYSHTKLKQMPGNRLTLPPDLCIEVLSPSNPEDDRINKFHLYESNGVPNYWIVDPDARTAESYGLQNGKYVLTLTGRDFETVHFAPFNDLSIPLSELWTPGV